MNILGISCYYHDAAAVLLCDGQIVAAIEEERLSRLKHDSSFPKLAIDFCLRQAGILGKDLDYVVFYEKPFRKFHRILISYLSTYPKSYKAFCEAMVVWLTQKLWIKQEIASYLKVETEKILFCEHHLSHAASCYYPSPFGKAAILTVDGVGEWATLTYCVGEDNHLTLLQEQYFPQSLGLLYSAFTAFLGFEVNEGEWKVMGLAPFGKPKYTDKIWKVVRKNQDGSFSLDLSYFSFYYSETKTFSKKFIDLFGQPVSPKSSHLVNKYSADLAASVQAVTEELLLNVVRNLKRRTKLNNLCLSGGVALNSVANYQILKRGGFKNIYIQPAAGDSGGALGAALYVYHHVLHKKKRQTMKTAYWGEEYSDFDIESFLKKEDIAYTRFSYDNLVSNVAQKIAQGKVVGWMQGRFEWGPRSLGNRSILADARNPAMKEIINSKVKFRESFRPFAPSVLEDKAYLFFDLPDPAKDHYPLRFMQYVLPVKKEWRKKVPAITHIDNTARPQLVYKEDNLLYYKLISAFYKKTGVPLILNTSFNLKGQPIVASPKDAYSTFERSGIDLLVLGHCVVEKKQLEYNIDFAI
ncbi:hypothetical protein A2960_05010 [Candidatus Gottesmanbacteria bacterium RIFCSPLOWO2_01_FULL_39_12b]|uniref:Carbamoyltransferase n=1 Tax=Candidatus Gottesmanbacteria bacterium RIFCSPLOWO2_01_FULL_39_12b TaxID=1798388 RepID=A0A1F6ALX1_9BACT|nr:MAG: hypothetical protein A2960_05010 [Candidatus Gottesmanbacteria bacterium RIFCSPLOWO2_01_FULL_39_12b]